MAPVAASALSLTVAETLFRVNGSINSDPPVNGSASLGLVKVETPSATNAPRKANDLSPSHQTAIILSLCMGITVIGIILSCWRFKRRYSDVQIQPVPAPPRPAGGNAGNEMELQPIQQSQNVVPRHIIESLPCYVYPDPSDLSNKQAKENVIEVPDSKSDSNDQLETPSLPSPPSAPTPNFRQLGNIPKDCEFCWDDFVPNESMVRELPCGHAFHPNCVDRYLTSYRDDCPKCRMKVLPQAAPASHSDGNQERQEEN